MSERTVRYNFDGYTFGDNGDVQLEIYTLKESGYGYTVKFAIELTLKERKQLIKFLKTIDDKDKN